VTGIGERSGNANFEETATALRTLYDVELDLDYGRFTELARRTAAASGVQIPPSKPIVGPNQFRVEAGIIVAWWNRLREKGLPLAMYPYHWDLVGAAAPEIVIGKMSGLATVQYWCDRLGLELPSESEQEEILAGIKSISIEGKRELDLEEFVELYRDVLGLE
ncbi:MAG: hypothetical protein R3324_10230, partial [Halobacteriales archaeon]|nr:hypothetical protein [Halobacteriales archaeon]